MILSPVFPSNADGIRDDFAGPLIELLFAVTLPQNGISLGQLLEFTLESGIPLLFSDSVKGGGEGQGQEDGNGETLQRFDPEAELFKFANFGPHFARCGNNGFERFIR